jgi:hypothetical protein
VGGLDLEPQIAVRTLMVGNHRFTEWNNGGVSMLAGNSATILYFGEEGTKQLAEWFRNLGKVAKP